MGRSLSKTVGPLLAAFLISAFSPISSLWIDGASFLFVFGIMLLINTPKNPLNVEEVEEVKNNKEKESFLLSVKEGLFMSLKVLKYFL